MHRRGVVFAPDDVGRVVTVVVSSCSSWPDHADQGAYDSPRCCYDERPGCCRAPFDDPEGEERDAEGDESSEDEVSPSAQVVWGLFPTRGHKDLHARLGRAHPCRACSAADTRSAGCGFPRPVKTADPTGILRTGDAGAGRQDEVPAGGPEPVVDGAGERDVAGWVEADPDPDGAATRRTSAHRRRPGRGRRCGRSPRRTRPARCGRTAARRAG